MAVIELKTQQVTEPEVNADVVRVLESLLTQAKAGKVTGLAVCHSKADGTISTALEMSDNRFAMSHAINALAFRFMQRMAEDAYEPKEETEL